MTAAGGRDGAGTASGTVAASDDRTAGDVLVREATADDAAAMVGLRVLMFEAMGTAADEVADAAWRHGAHQWFLGHIGRPGVRVVVAEVAEQVVAGAVGEVTTPIPGPGTANGCVGLISNVATLHAHRGRGLASAVTDALLTWFVEDTDVTRVDLFATAAGARIYAPRGFVVRAFPPMSLPVAPRG